MSGQADKSELQVDNPEHHQADSVISASEPDISSAPASEAEKSSGGILKFIVFLVLVAVIVTGGLAANGQLEPLLESARSAMSNLKSELDPVADSTTAADTLAGTVPDNMEAAVLPSESEAVAEQPEPVFEDEQSLPEPVVEQVLPESVDALPEPEPVVQAESAFEAPASVSSEQVDGLLATIDSLRSELRSMEDSRRQLQAGLTEQRQLNLQARLRWINDPSARLPQMQLAWEEISLMPDLSAGQRATAEQMHKLARNNGSKLRSWQETLNKWADVIAVPVHEDVLQQPGHPWLAWLVGQFHLRKAPSVEAKKLSVLRERLLAVASQLALESWPEPGSWQALRAQLLLQANSMQPQENSAPVELGLPDDFTAVEADIKKVRETARQWAQSGHGGA